MLATVKDDGASNKRVEGLRNAWAQYLENYSSIVKDAEPEHIASTVTSETLAARRWFGQYYPAALSNNGMLRVSVLDVCSGITTYHISMSDAMMRIIQLQIRAD